MTADQADAQGHIVVLGDLMLDIAEHGEVSRVSPEAPVVVLLNTVRDVVLGGAGNTAANTLSLGHPTAVVGVVGDDDAGEECRALIQQNGLVPGLVLAGSHPTTTKTRFLSGGHQIMRWDRESASIPESAEQHLARELETALAGALALVISDYDKGAVSPAIARTAITLARRDDIPVVVDTKKRDVSCFEGCTVIAPNHHEARAITGHTDPTLAAQAIASATKSAVIVTLGAQGMLILDGDESGRIASEVQEVSDVTGAGDTVTAGLAVALADGTRSIREAASWANRAAAVAVSHAGTYAVPRSAVGPEPTA